eukprot:154861-Rhodomonas_salina.2
MTCSGSSAVSVHFRHSSHRSRRCGSSAADPSPWISFCSAGSAEDASRRTAATEKSAGPPIKATSMQRNAKMTPFCEPSSLAGTCASGEGLACRAALRS